MAATQEQPNELALAAEDAAPACGSADQAYRQLIEGKAVDLAQMWLWSSSHLSNLAKAVGRFHDALTAALGE